MGGAPLRLWSVLQAPPTVFYCWPIWSETNGIKKKLLFLECFKKILFILARGFEKDSSSTLTSKATGTKRNVIALLIDNAVMYAIHHLVDICLQFQLYPLLFVHLVIVLGFWAVAP